VKEKQMFSRWLRVARYLLEPRDIVQSIEPTIADALHERDSEKNSRAWLWRSRWHLICAIGCAFQYCVWRRWVVTSWFGFVALILAGLSGAVVLRQGPVPNAALGQCVYLTVAAVFAMIVVTAPTKFVHSLGTLYLLLALVGLVLCPWFGVAYDGQRQWLKFGAYQIHVATACLPAYVTFIRRTLLSRRYAGMIVGSLAVLGLILLQHNPQAAMVYMLIVTVTMLERWANWVSWIMTFALGLVTAATVGHVAEVASWLTLGVLALFLANGWAIYRGFVAQKNGVRSAQTLSMAMVALSVLRGVDGDTLPVVGFGGSACVAFFVLTALQMRADVGGPDSELRLFRPKRGPAPV
jgi:cell division protein FtsW (lipid II flippase)